MLHGYKLRKVGKGRSKGKSIDGIGDGLANNELSSFASDKCREYRRAK